MRSTQATVIAIAMLTAAILTCGSHHASAAVLLTTGLQAHFKSDAGVSTSGANVTAWADQAPLNGANNATAVGTNPTLVSVPFGYHASYPVVQFVPGRPLTFALPAANAFSGVTIIAVANTTSVKTTGDEVFLSTGFTGGSPGVRWAFGMGGGTSFGFGWAESGGTLALGSGASISTNTWHFLSWALANSGNQWTVRNDKPSSLLIASPTDNSFFTGAWNGVIGTENASNPTQYGFDGQIAELLIYDRKLSTLEYQSVMDYLDARYFTAPIPPVVPEPSTFALLVLGAAAMAWRVRRRRG